MEGNRTGKKKRKKEEVNCIASRNVLPSIYILQNIQFAAKNENEFLVK